MDSIRQLCNGKPLADSFWQDLQSLIARWAFSQLQLRSHRRPGAEDVADTAQSFITEQLLSEQQAGLRYIGRLAKTEADARALLQTMLKRHLATDEPPSLLGNKRRSLRRILRPPKYSPLAGYEEVYGPAAVRRRPMSDSEFTRSLPKWLENLPAVNLVPGSPDSTQLPVLVHNEDLERLVDYLFARAGTCLRFCQIFAFVARAIDLVHWDSIYRLRLVPAPEPEGGESAPVFEPADPTGDPGTAIAASLDRPALVIRAAELAGELTAEQQAYLRFQLNLKNRPDSASTQSWLKQHGIPRSTFYERVFAPLRRKMSAWRAEHPDLPPLVLDRVRSGDRAARRRGTRIDP